MESLYLIPRQRLSSQKVASLFCPSTQDYFLAYLT
jgi:hypothetical protein